MHRGKDASPLVILFQMRPTHLFCCIRSKHWARIENAAADTRFKNVGDATVQVKVSTPDVEDKLDDEGWYLASHRPVDVSIYELTTRLAAGNSFINMSSKSLGGVFVDHKVHKKEKASGKWSRRPQWQRLDLTGSVLEIYSFLSILRLFWDETRDEQSE
jgi:hypothetical protein